MACVCCALNRPLCVASINSMTAFDIIHVLEEGNLVFFGRVCAMGNVSLQFTVYSCALVLNLWPEGISTFSLQLY